MPYISTVERDNIAAAAEQALQQGQRTLVLKQLVRRLGALHDHDRAAVDALASDRIEALAEALLDFASTDDLRLWLSARRHTRTTSR